MSIFDRFSKGARAFWERKEERWERIGDVAKRLFRSEWAGGLKSFMKTILIDVFAPIYKDNKAAILGLVVQIAKGNYNPDLSKPEAFVGGLKEILDSNQDGHVKWDDLDGNRVDLIRSAAVEFMRTFDPTDDDVAAGLLEQWLEEHFG